VPCITYNLPSRTATNLTADTLIRLSQIDNIVGVREASGKFGQLAEIVQGTREDFFTCGGSDRDTLPVLVLDGHGLIKVASRLVGIQMKGMIEKCFDGKFQEATRIHRYLLPLIDALFIISDPVPVK
jgi:4-hydroxy-tetrahydrodipicolinate synthase